MTDALRLEAIDAEGFYAELQRLRKELGDALGPEDLEHLERFARWGRACTAVGLATAWIAPNPVSAVSLALGRSLRWIVMHHVAHRGYDKVPGVPERWTSRVFARGERRYRDWLDWMIPEAWIYEHNVLHHAYTGEAKDPDIVEQNTDWLRRSGLPMPLRYAVVGFFALTWRFTYYAPNTLRVYRARHEASGRSDAPMSFARELITRCYLPYGAVHFGLMPLAYAPLGPWAVASAWCNSVMAEAITNLHSFAVITTNHTGDDLYRYDDRPKSKAEAMVRQVMGSVNFPCGTDLIDAAHMYLNYQIEHHLWPDLPMLKYRQAQPKVKALCEKYGIPYVQEPIAARVRQLVGVAVGKRSMRRVAARDTSAAAEGLADESSA